MSKGKTGLIVLTLLAVMFFLFIAILFGSSTQRQGNIDRKAELETQLDIIAQMDLTIYWIGEVPKELEHLMPVITVIPPETASEENLPIKVFQYHVSQYDTYGNFVSESYPREYPEHMLIVLYGDLVLSDPGREALLDCISKNGVPVIALGDEAATYLAKILQRVRYHPGPGSSLYYCLGKGYKENLIPVEKVAAGGIDLAEGIPVIIEISNADYVPQ